MKLVYTILAVSAMLVVLGIVGDFARSAVMCAQSYDSSKHRWAYRMVDGKKCWYRLDRVREPNEKLVWPK